MARRFKRVNYEEAGKQTVTIDDCLPAAHLARFIVAIVSMLDLSAIYACYAATGGEAFAPEILLGLLFYGYATSPIRTRRL
jgi:transposase